MLTARSRLRAAAALATVLLLTACGDAGAGGSDGSIRLYTSVTQATVDAVIEGFAASAPGIEVAVFRAPTGEVTARIAAERREGGIQADVLWLSDPLSVQQYDHDGLLESWTPAEAGALPADLVTDTSWATRILTLVIVHQIGLDPPPQTWADLTDPSLAGAVALPDPGFAGSALGALGYFATADGYGLGYYRQLRANGAVQVASPGEVVTGVAEGRFAAGLTLDFTARAAIEKGSPIAIAHPLPGGIAIPSPIAVLATSDEADAAHRFVEFVLSRDGQDAIAATGWQPARPDVPWDSASGPTVTVDWALLAERRTELLDAYRAIFDD